MATRPRGLASRILIRILRTLIPCGGAAAPPTLASPRFAAGWQCPRAAHPLATCEHSAPTPPPRCISCVSIMML
eukprot:1603470-Alexandrium_andersonii.AAC.1